MHSNPSSLSLCTSYCSPSEWKVASRLILADTICQFVLFFIATINHHACMYANDQNFVKPARKTGKSNKSCAHVWKKRPWLGRSEATCHQIDPVTRQPVVAGGDMPTGLWHQPVTGCHIKGRKTKLYKPYSGSLLYCKQKAFIWIWCILHGEYFQVRKPPLKQYQIVRHQYWDCLKLSLTGCCSLDRLNSNQTHFGISKSGKQFCVIFY